MEYGEKKTIVITFEVERQPGIFFAVAKSEDMGLESDRANSSNNSANDLWWAMEGAFRDLMARGWTQRLDLKRKAEDVELKPAKQKILERLEAFWTSLGFK